jgi:hypothetical protein
MSYFTDPMGASLDRWITGNYGEDQYSDEEFCKDCIFWDVRTEREGGFCNRHNKHVEAEEWCVDFESDEYDPSDDEPQDLDEWRDRES